MGKTNFPNGLTVDGFSSPTDVTITVGTETTNVINVALQFKGGDGENLDNAAAVFGYLSDDSAGAGITATAPDGGASAGTDGAVIPVLDSKAGYWFTEADGSVDFDLTESGAGTWYLVVVLPSGRTVVSDAITFAA